jgi:hypothetical protein
MLGKNKILQMTPIEIETCLNDNISTLIDESTDEVILRKAMINKVESLLDENLKISVPKYTNTDFIIIIGRVKILFKVSTKNTDKTQQISKLKKTYIKRVGKFKFSDIEISFYNPCFISIKDEGYEVELDKWSCTGAVISLKNKDERLIDILSKEKLIQEIETQNEEWQDIRKAVILNAAQDKIKSERFKPGFDKSKWDLILHKTEKVNKDLIDSEIDKMFDLGI